MLFANLTGCSLSQYSGYFLWLYKINRESKVVVLDISVNCSICLIRDFISFIVGHISDFNADDMKGTAAENSILYAFLSVFIIYIISIIYTLDINRFAVLCYHADSFMEQIQLRNVRQCGMVISGILKGTLKMIDADTINEDFTINNDNDIYHTKPAKTLREALMRAVLSEWTLHQVMKKLQKFDRILFNYKFNFSNFIVNPANFYIHRFQMDFWSSASEFPKSVSDLMDTLPWTGCEETIMTIMNSTDYLSKYMVQPSNINKGISRLSL